MVEIHFWLEHNDENNKKLSSGIDIAFLKLSSERIDWNRQGNRPSWNRPVPQKL